MADRIWCDNPYCKPLVDNIITGFNTKQPPKSLLTSESWTPTSRDTSSPLTVNAIDEDEGNTRNCLIFIVSNRQL